MSVAENTKGCREAHFVGHRQFERRLAAGCDVLRVPFLFGRIECPSTCAMAHGAPSECVPEARSGPPAGSDGVDGLYAQLRQQNSSHGRAMGDLGFPFETVFLPFQHENSVNVKGTSEFLQV